MNTLLKTLLLLFALFNFSLITAQESTTSAEDRIITPEELGILFGEWTGSLTYLDYSSNTPYTMRADLRVEKGKNENQLVLFTTYPDEAGANSKGKIGISKNGSRLNKKDIQSKKRLESGQIQITTVYSGKDNRKKAMIRNIYILGTNEFIIRKDVQFENSTEWMIRNEYSYLKKI